LFYRADTTRAEQASGDIAISKKLDKILENQRQLMQKQDEILEELHIVKIRATR
jgi:hypothetical protein